MELRIDIIIIGMDENKYGASPSPRELSAGARQ
jgi:hypothetical protein